MGNDRHLLKIFALLNRTNVTGAFMHTRKLSNDVWPMGLHQKIIWGDFS